MYLQHVGCTCNPPDDETLEPIFIVGASKTNFATSKNSGIWQLRDRLALNTTPREPARGCPNNVTTGRLDDKAVGLKAFLALYSTINLWLVLFDSNHHYAEYQASDVVEGFSNFGVRATCVSIHCKLPRGRRSTRRVINHTTVCYRSAPGLLCSVTDFNQASMSPKEPEIRDVNAICWWSSEPPDRGDRLPKWTRGIPKCQGISDECF